MVRPEHRVVQGDAGFTLVEALVSLMVLAVIFTALAYASIGTLRASLSSRVEQQAVDFATQQLEVARQADFSLLANRDADMSPSQDPRITVSGSAKVFDPGTGTPEPLVLNPSGSVSPHTVAIAASTANQVPFLVSTYVTDPGQDSAAVVRVTVVARWSVGGQARERMVTTLVTATTRGLPVPVFKLTPVGGTAAAVNPTARVTFGFELTNQGAPDVWDIRVSGWGSWSLLRDDGDGRLCLEVSDEPGGCAAVDPPLTDSSDPGSEVDTGRVDPTDSIVFWATSIVPADTSAGTLGSTLTADSASSDDPEVGVASLDLVTQVVSGTVSATPQPEGPAAVLPGTPQALLLTPGSGQVTAGWSPPLSSGSSPVTDYLVRYRASADTAGAWTTVADGTSTATTAVVPGLANSVQYDVQVLAVSAAGSSAVPASASVTPMDVTAYVAPVRCAAVPSAPSGTAAQGFTLRGYSLHNRSDLNSTWPGTGVPAETTTTQQGLPLKAAVDGPQFGVGVSLPVYSADVAAGVPGRVVRSGGGLTSADPTRVIDWRTNVAGRAYSGTAVLRLWIAPVPGDSISGVGYSLSAQLYRQAQSQSSPATNKLEDPHSSSAVVLDAPSFACGSGWQEVTWQLPVNTKGALSTTEYLGVRLWNNGGASRVAQVRVAYDIAGDFPAALTVPES